MQHKYALWIMPTGETGTQLQNLINQLADEYNAPKFTPHVTIAGIMVSDEELANVKSKLGRLASQQNAFTINLTEYGYKDENHRCLYRQAISKELDFTFQNAAELFPEAKIEHFWSMPHVSIMYGQYPTSLKQEIIKELPTSAISFEAREISLCLADGTEEDWHIVYNAKLVNYT
jgi:2'-5' RNA ligase